jgi:hypothetical protein
MLLNGIHVIVVYQKDLKDKEKFERRILEVSKKGFRGYVSLKCWLKLSLWSQLIYCPSGL